MAMAPSERPASLQKPASEAREHARNAATDCHHRMWARAVRLTDPGLGPGQAACLIGAEKPAHQAC
ncbi:hypothetical protein Pma05_84830 [Plantactinospora mayteni]|uniref:Uncharacterized protein n=1 Tax=Plantactinospora mayteni TaxID=566021 RepID=A0ABQ4F4S9_9ACTN|nr:hypothetical protein Pma05_84830 [Plantactinospora mayteni]